MRPGDRPVLIVAGEFLRKRRRSYLASCCIACGLGGLGSLIAHVVAAVSARVFAQIILVIVLGAVPGGGGLNGCRKRALPFPGCIYTRPHSFRRCLLLRRLRKDRRSILGASVVTLAVECRWIVQLEEPLL